MKMDGRNHGHHKYEGGRLPPTSLLRIITYFSQFATLLCSLNFRGGRTAWEYRRTIRIFQRGGRHDDPLEILLIQFYSSHNLCSWGRTRRDARPSNSNKILSGPRDNFCVGPSPPFFSCVYSFVYWPVTVGGIFLCLHLLQRIVVACQYRVYRSVFPLRAVKSRQSARHRARRKRTTTNWLSAEFYHRESENLI